MAAQSKKGILASHYGAGGDIAKEIASDVSLPSAGFQDPPPGIKNGFGQLEEVKVDVYKSGTNEGKPYFAFVGVIVAPITHTYTPTSKGISAGDPVTVQVADMQTRIQIGVHDKKIGSGPNMGKVIGWQEAAKEVGVQFRGLGFDTSKVRTLQDLEDLAERATAIARNPKTPVYFKFSTSVRKAQNAGELDGAWQNWNGLAPDDYEPPSRDSVPNDNSGDVAPGGDTGSDFRGQGNIHDDNPLGENIEADGTDITTLDLDALLAAAEAEEDDVTVAQDELMLRAVEASGLTEDAIREIPDIDLPGLYALANGEAGAPEGRPKEPLKKGDHVNYYPVQKGIGGKPGKKATKPTECSITSINQSKKTAALKSTVDGKEFKDVPLAELEDIS